jgi:Ca2+/H+ antiporter
MISARCLRSYRYYKFFNPNFPNKAHPPDPSKIHQKMNKTELKTLIVDGPLNLLLFCIPVAIATYYGDTVEAVPFLFALLALAPLAERLGFVTEQLSLHTNETVGGLLNATFGNATELIIAVIALYKKLFRLVQLSLLGSILSNMLLVLGTAFLCGGIKYVRKGNQQFNKITTQVNSVLLMICTMSILLPTALVLGNKQPFSSGLTLSRGSSLLALALYIGLIFFQLKTHKALFESGSYSSPAEHPLDHHPTASSILTFNGLMHGKNSPNNSAKYRPLTTQLNELDETAHDFLEKHGNKKCKQLNVIKEEGEEEEEENEDVTNPNEMTTTEKVHLAVLSRHFLLNSKDDDDDDDNHHEEADIEHGQEDDDETTFFGSPREEGNTTLNILKKVPVDFGSKNTPKDSPRGMQAFSTTRDHGRSSSIDVIVDKEEEEGDNDEEKGKIINPLLLLDQKPEKMNILVGNNDSHNTEEEEVESEEEEEQVLLQYHSCLIFLTIITVFIAFLSEIISSTIEEASSSLRISSVFTSTIILPIVGNAAEHTSAIVFAMKNKLNLTMGIAIGSSTQIALCVLPLVVILGWMSGLEMTLEFGPYESMCLFLSVFAMTIALKDGLTNWLIGLCLLAAYVIIAMGFLVQKDEPLSGSDS